MSFLNYFFNFFFLYIRNILWVTKKPPKMFTAANIIAISPNKFEISIFDVLLAANAAIIAPTIITDDMALVTDIKGVCNDGVTLQTT